MGFTKSACRLSWREVLRCGAPRVTKPMTFRICTFTSRGDSARSASLDTITAQSEAFGHASLRTRWTIYATKWHTLSVRRVFKTRHFRRWLRKSGLSDRALCQAVKEMIAGLIDADLGGGLVKKRVGLPGRGKRGGARTLVATNKGSRWFFVFGFEKNERANISGEELEALQDLAADLLARTSAQLGAAVADGTLQEICHDDQT
jgi:hypothetical protein